MRRIRNPRYAPEWLEPRLSPSGLVAPALYAPADGGTPTDPEAPLPRDSKGNPIPDPYPVPEPGPVVPD